MKISVLNIEGTEVKKMDVPVQFNEELRPDLVKRAALVVSSNTRQRYGASPEAGKRSSSRVSKRRRDYRGCYGHGISRVPRKVMSRNGIRFNWVGAFAPGTVGGRKAHPPKSSKVFAESFNKKERKKAIRCALSATLDAKAVSKRGHIVPKNYPFILDSSFENITKTKDIVLALEKLGLSDELIRVSERKIRSGKGKMRGRPYKSKSGPLIVLGKNSALINAVKNIPGVKVIDASKLNAKILAPGAHQGRLTLYTESAIAKIADKKLFM